MIDGFSGEDWGDVDVQPNRTLLELLGLKDVDPMDWPPYPSILPEEVLAEVFCTE